MTKQLGDWEEPGQHELLVHLEWINSLEYFLKMTSTQIHQRGAGKLSSRIPDAQILVPEVLITP